MARETEGTPRGGERTGTETTNIQTFLKGCTFPCGRQDIVKQVQKNKAPNDVVERLRQLPDQRFKNENEVREAFGRIPARTGAGREAVTPSGRGR